MDSYFFASSCAICCAFPVADPYRIQRGVGLFKDCVGDASTTTAAFETVEVSWEVLLVVTVVGSFSNCRARNAATLGIDPIPGCRARTSATLGIDPIPGCCRARNAATLGIDPIPGNRPGIAGLDPGIVVDDDDADGWDVRVDGRAGRDPGIDETPGICGLSVILDFLDPVDGLVPPKLESSFFSSSTVTSLSTLVELSLPLLLLLSRHALAIKDTISSTHPSTTSSIFPVPSSAKTNSFTRVPPHSSNFLSVTLAA